MPPKESAKGNKSVAQLSALVTEQWKREIHEGHLPLVCDSLELLSNEEIWWRANGASNSAGNLVLHLCGNLRQWIVSGLGGVEFKRDRDREFSEQGPLERAELIEKIRGAVRDSSRVIARLSAVDLVKPYKIQGYDVTGYEAVIHVMTHFTYHAGQIIYVAKMKGAKDLGFTKLPAPSAKKKSRP